MNAKELLEYEDKPIFKPQERYIAKDNAGDMNNLGHEELTEDFSDSKSLQRNGQTLQVNRQT